MCMVFLYGAPATGKLTVGRELARRTGFRLFHNHLTVDLLLSLFAFGSEPFVMLREQIWLLVFREAALNGTSFIFTFMPESTVGASFVSDTVEAVGSAGGKVVFVELSCLAEELEKRMESASRAEFGKLNSAERYRELRESGAFAFPYMPEPDLSVDTTDIPPEETARRIHEHFALT